ncbi:transmembrane channel-like protein [Galleria mellonella]|uniref:Transmembrane channel-like protein n=1 Tax=Galleria mellonella TaxID=7137 RepID=A0ABM3MJA4_GALME|nr:transmembrane channel-like protein [Galleria mellonella]
MDKGREKGILKLDPRPRVYIDNKHELTPQGSCEQPPISSQPSFDRLSVTWADPGSMASSGVNLCHLPSETPISNEVKFSPSAGEGSEDEDYSASLSAVLRQRRASLRRSRKGRARRSSSPFLADEGRSRRRSSVFTTSSGDTAISMEDGQSVIVTQEQIFQNIHLHKEVLGSVKQQPLGMRRKLKIVHQAKTYIKRHEGQLQERLAQSKSTRDIYARFTILLAAKWQQLKREAANTSNLLIPWELRIKEIESHFGSVVASYFTFLRWLFWVNLVIGFILLVFVIIPEYLTADPQQDGSRKIIMEEERRNATNLLTLWEFEGVLKCSPIFYGYYSNIERPQYWMPLAYFLTGLVVYIYSFVAILRKMAENSRMSKLSEKEDECIFSWKLFTGWDFMIGNTETAHNRIASVILGFKEALLEEAEKKKDLRKWRIISLRALVNICVVILLAVSAYAVVTVVSRSDDTTKSRSWWRENETTIVVTLISITFPVFFELLGFLEHYHPRKQLRLQLARIMLLNLLNLYSLIFALFSKIEGMSKELDLLKPVLDMNASLIPNSTLDMSESMAINVPTSCHEERVSCEPCDIINGITLSHISNLNSNKNYTSTTPLSLLSVKPTYNNGSVNKINKIDQTIYSTRPNPKIYPSAENLIENEGNTEALETTTVNIIIRELERLRNISGMSDPEDDLNDPTSYIYDYDFNDTLPTGDTATINYYLNNNTIPFVYTIDNFTSSEDNVTNNFEEIPTSSEISSNDLYTDKSFTQSDNMSTMIEFDYTSDINSTESTTTTYYETESSFFNTFPSVQINNSALTSTDIESTEYDTTTTTDWSESTILYTDTTYYGNGSYSSDVDSTITSINTPVICPEFFNCTSNCGGHNITQIFIISKCVIVEKVCFKTICEKIEVPIVKNKTNETIVDVVYLDENNRKMYNLTVATKKKLLKLCWETMFGQELVKLTMMDLVFVLLGTLFMDFFRALFVRYMNRCWCWDLEKKFPEYGDFKIAENILHLINNQGMVWMGMFFSPGLVVLNVAKLMIMMYLRSWAVMTCNVPHEVVFRVSKSNNFYLALLLTMLFLCVLPVGYTIVWVKPSWHCGPFSEYDKIYYILTNNIYKILPKSLNFTLEYITSPAIVIPLLVLLILIIYYLTSLTNSLREANNDLKIQLRRERTEERRKMFQLAHTRRRVGSSAMDNTPFARWKKALPSLPLSKSIDSVERKSITADDISEPGKTAKKKGSIFAKIVGMAVDKKPDIEVVSETNNGVSPSSNNADEETDTDFHESLPKEVLKIKDIIFKNTQNKKKISVEFKTNEDEKSKFQIEDKSLKVKLEKVDDRTEKKAILEKQDRIKKETGKSKTSSTEAPKQTQNIDKKLNKKQTSESSNLSRQSDSISSVIPVITISTTESDEEILQSRSTKNIKKEDEQDSAGTIAESLKKINKRSSDLKSLRRQRSVDSINEPKKKPDDGHKYKYPL